ncbi:BsuPI-related putative proteinase inhibitor [Planococcus lenghuensis]|uniref:Intracellular proteinase inhibitor BsuPI domain-containing protein n=1 Tax=Planococcus lenghuensis TaxID=2213202 RepID=A0A1Q2KUH0_9BACL|nr:BsuPI-related putative proteinase inhibitor [Planococcus lenghuensis]AQQ51829.1 hypothetical protein B0X71_00975 [Planococcus lenghuensis]
MEKRNWAGPLLALLFILVLAACGTEEVAPEVTEEVTEEEVQEEVLEEETENDGETTGGIVAGEVEPMIEPVDDDTYRYILKNQKEEAVTFNFTSGQRFDFALLNKAGEQLYLLSSVSTYIQALSEETIAPGEELSYEFDLPQLDLEPDTYTIKAWLTPEDGPAYEVETEYVVE